MAGESRAAEHGRQPEAHTWEEWHELEPVPSEQQQVPVQLTPIPSYENPTISQHEHSRGHNDPEKTRDERVPRLPHVQKPEKEQPSPAFEVVYVPDVPVRPAPTSTEPVTTLPKRRRQRRQSVPVTITHLMEPGAYSEPAKSDPHQTIPHEPPNNSAPTPKIRPSNNSKNSADTSYSEPKSELKKPNETVVLEPFERIGRVGRQRKYEAKGNRGENSVRDVVLYRYIKAKHYPHLSSDMKRWYEFFYFTSPMKGEKPFNANTSYEQHCEAYQRGQGWISRYDSQAPTRSLGHRGPVDLHERRAAH